MLPNVVPAERHIPATDLLELYVAAGRLDEAEPLSVDGPSAWPTVMRPGGRAGAPRWRARAVAALERERSSLLAGQALAARGEEDAPRQTIIAVEARCAASAIVSAADDTPRTQR